MEWQHFVLSVDSCDVPAGGPVTAEEFRHVVLIVMLAVSNPCEWYIRLFYIMFICLFARSQL